MSANRPAFLGSEVFAGSQQFEQRLLALVLGLLAASSPTYQQGPPASVADTPFPLGGTTFAFGYDHFEHRKCCSRVAERTEPEYLGFRLRSRNVPRPLGTGLLL